MNYTPLSFNILFGLFLLMLLVYSFYLDTFQSFIKIVENRRGSISPTYKLHFILPRFVLHEETNLAGDLTSTSYFSVWLYLTFKEVWGKWCLSLLLLVISTEYKLLLYVTLQSS